PAPVSDRRNRHSGYGYRCSSDPWARRFGDMLVPALCPEHAVAAHPPLDRPPSLQVGTPPSRPSRRKPGAPVSAGAVARVAHPPCRMLRLPRGTKIAKCIRLVEILSVRKRAVLIKASCCHGVANVSIGSQARMAPGASARGKYLYNRTESLHRR